jgi:phosphoribosylformimino-5-aminoimidazole carboxamide ribotide isomerase
LNPGPAGDHSPRLVPVLDVMGGIAVHAVAGDRANYKPLRSCLASASDPAPLVRAYRESLGCGVSYLADLDAIRGDRPPAMGLYREIRESGGGLWIDAGIRRAADVAALVNEGIDGVIVGLETCPMAAWADVVREAGARRAIFSLDLRGGIPIAAPSDLALAGLGGPEIARLAIAAGFRRLLVLDLARVGIGSGPGTLELVAELAALDPTVEIIAGGGVRGIGDVRALLGAGAVSVLVGSALHDGRIGRAEIDALS